VRRIAFIVGLVCVAIAGVIAYVVPTSAVPKAAAAFEGDVTCGLDGTMTFSRPLPNAESDPATGITRIRLTATMSGCDGGGAVGGAARIAGGTVTITGILDAEESCADIADGTPPDFTFETNRFDAKWTAKVGKSRVVLGHSKTNVFSTGDYLFGAWQYMTDSFGDADMFAGQSATFDLANDNTIDVLRCGRGDLVGEKPAVLGSVSFTAARGSRIIVES